MNEQHKVYILDKLNTQIIDRNLFKKLKSDESVDHVKVKINASHAGKTNGNKVFYTPKAMESGAITLIKPYSKTIQSDHYATSVGVIDNSQYVDYSSSYPEEIINIQDAIDNATTARELVYHVKRLTKHPFYQSDEYKGLGVLAIDARLFNTNTITRLRTGANKGKVSIGGDSSNAYCSICCQPYGDKHEHVRGVKYDGEECFIIVDNLSLDHVGFVQDPADVTTSTEILDSLSLNNDNTVTLESFKIKDNKQGIKMNIEQLKELVKDLDSFVKVEGLTEAQQELLKKSYTTSTKGAKASSYLISENKLLPLTSKEMVALAYVTVQGLEDSEDKQTLNEQLKIHLEKHDLPEGEEVLKYLQSLNVEPETPAEPQTATQDTGTADIKDFTLTDTDVTRIAEAVKAQLQETVKVEDSKQNFSVQNLIAQNRELVTDYKVLDELKRDLEGQLKEQLIKNILLVNSDLKDDSEYVKLLQERSIQGLTTTLQDLEYSVSVKTRQQSKEPEQGQTETPADNVTSTVTETPVAAPTVEPEQPEQGTQEPLNKTSIQDSMQNVVQDEDTKTSIEDSLKNESDEELIKRHGLSVYLKMKRMNKSK